MMTILPNGEGIKWPEGKQVAVMLTFDFDADQLQVARFPNKPIFADQSRGLYGPDEGIIRCLRMLDKLQISATFFIPGVICERYPHHIRSIVDGGHEIAYHGYLHDSNAVFVPIEKELINLEKSETLIEKFSGRKPVGCRPPGGYLQPYTYDLISKRGYKYSSALTSDRCCDWAYIIEGNNENSSIVEFCTDPILDDFSYFFFTLSDPIQKFLYNNDYVREIWQDEFDGLRTEGDKIFCLKLHPSLIGRASRIHMLEEFVLYMENNGAWIATCEEVADYVIKYNETTWRTNESRLP